MARRAAMTGVIGSQQERATGRAAAPAAVPVLACRDLVKAYGDRTAVAGVSFDVFPGQAFGLLGPNGAGKTSTIKMICGLLEPDRGEALIGGKRVARSAEARRLLGYVPHDIALYPDLSAYENLEFWGRLYGLRGKRLTQRVDYALEVVDLVERRHDRVGEFSSGMQRRCNLAVALLGEPRLLVLDEPTVGVDPQSRGAILERLEELRASGVALLLASHYIDEVERFCDSVGIIDHGKLVVHGRPADLIASLGGAQRLEVEAAGNVGALIQTAFAMPGVHQARLIDGSVRLSVDNAAATLPALVEAAHALGVELSSIDIGTANLEAVFLHLTGRTMRD
jgi:linearmycin/streptolysin S transport system ATP-binding protein